MTESVYEWPALLQDREDPFEVAWVQWAYQTKDELSAVYEIMFQPLPDNPVELDGVVTEWIDGWLPRVAALAVKAEWYLAVAKSLRYPQPRMGENGKPVTVDERNAEYEGKLAGFRFVRDELDALVRRMNERVRWAQSVRKQQGDAQ